MPIQQTIYKSATGRAAILDYYSRYQAELSLPFESSYIQTRFGRTHVLTGGPADGEPLLYLQGGNVVSPITLKWFEELAKKYRVIAPDTIGHPGQSDEVRLSSACDDYARWVEDILDQFSVKQAHFAGPSFGGGIILKCAAYIPQRIRKAVLVCPAGIADGSMLGMIFELLIPLLGYLARPTERNLVKAVRPLFDSADEMGRFQDFLGAIYRYVKVDPKVLFKPFTANSLRNLKAPMMLVAAGHDFFFPARKIVPRARKIIPNLMRVMTLQNSAHWLSEDSRKQVLKEMLDFLGE